MMILMRRFISLIILIFPSWIAAQTKPFPLFTVEPGSGHTVLMKWSVVPEIDTLELTVERSKDKISWERVINLPTRATHFYNFVDINPGMDVIYYRIRQVTEDDSYSGTDVKWVQISSSGKLYIWPNPVRNMLHIKTPYPKGIMEIKDSRGKLRLRMVITSLIIDIPTAQFSKGTYFIHVRYNGETLEEKFFKE